MFSITISCGTSKNKIALIKKTEQEKISDYIKAQNYTIEIPSSWHPVTDHNFVSYTPSGLNDQFYKNTVKIFNITTDEDKNIFLIDATNLMEKAFKNPIKKLNNKLKNK